MITANVPTGIEDEGETVVSLDPIFVLCNGRSGSTLLRFMLDAHPDIACPPETNVPALMAQLATVWSLIEGAPLSANRGDEPPAVPDAAVAGVRATMNLMIGSYLSRREKTRYCDKSLGTARYADFLLRVYPNAKFLCLYRHPMDVIASGLEACPWGLSGYGFDPYIATSPGNSVLALARFWSDSVSVILDIEERLGEHCLRVRYEDVVTDPEAECARIFGFLGATQAPGIAARCFSAERERHGPADHKIWYTSEVSRGSLGRGWTVPASMIPPPVLAHMSELCSKLGYLPVDGGWGTSAPPDSFVLEVGREAMTVRDPDWAADGQDVAAMAGSIASASAPQHSLPLADQLTSALRKVTDEKRAEWGSPGAEKLVAVWVPDDAAHPAEHWLVDLGTGEITFTSNDSRDESAWDLIGSGAAWRDVIDGRLNLSVAMRSCRLRYCDSDDSGPVTTEVRMRILAGLLGVAEW
jgi:hypothetical protein